MVEDTYAKEFLPVSKKERKGGREKERKKGREKEINNVSLCA
jgi:hypothetical protein